MALYLLFISFYTRAYDTNKALSGFILIESTWILRYLMAEGTTKYIRPLYTYSQISSPRLTRETLRLIKLAKYLTPLLANVFILA